MACTKIMLRDDIMEETGSVTKEKDPSNGSGRRESAQEHVSPSLIRHKIWESIINFGDESVEYHSFARSFISLKLKLRNHRSFTNHHHHHLILPLRSTLPRSQLSTVDNNDSHLKFFGSYQKSPGSVLSW